MRLIRMPLAAALSTLLLGGCMLGPNYTKPPAVADAAMRAPALHRASGADVVAAAPLNHWWEELHDPLLTQLVAQALADSPNLRAAQARLRANRALAQQRRAERLPKLNASAVYAYAEPPQTSSIRSAGCNRVNPASRRRPATRRWIWKRPRFTAPVSMPAGSWISSAAAVAPPKVRWRRRRPPRPSSPMRKCSWPPKSGRFISTTAACRRAWPLPMPTWTRSASRCSWCSNAAGRAPPRTCRSSRSPPRCSNSKPSACRWKCNRRRRWTSWH
ncbi:exported hypothetical protein [Xanthomonas citri pv. citri]|nr:exported hypothetical protein [Xanthomonas citri pv. citri]